MKTVRLICKECGHVFEREDYSPGRDEEKKGTGGCTVRCEKCGGEVEKG